MTKPLKILSTVTMIATLGLTVLTNWVNEQQQEEIIEKKVREALAEQNGDSETETEEG